MLYSTLILIFLHQDGIPQDGGDVTKEFSEKARETERAVLEIYPMTFSIQR